MGALCAGQKLEQHKQGASAWQHRTGSAGAEAGENVPCQVMT